MRVNQTSINKETKTFVIAELSANHNQKLKTYLSKFGNIEFIIISKWHQIVGSFFADHSEPEKISRITEEFNEF